MRDEGKYRGVWRRKYSQERRNGRMWLNRKGNRRGWHLRGPNKPIVRGKDVYCWKGDGASDGTKRARAQRSIPLGPCEKCGKLGVDRHHRDGDTGNNRRSNIAILCRRCHMEEDGRLQSFAALTPVAAQPPKPCIVCGQPYKPLRNGRCANCDAYLRRHGVERSEYLRSTRKERERWRRSN